MQATCDISITRTTGICGLMHDTHPVCEEDKNMYQICTLEIRVLLEQRRRWQHSSEPICSIVQGLRNVNDRLTSARRWQGTLAFVLACLPYDDRCSDFGGGRYVMTSRYRSNITSSVVPGPVGRFSGRFRALDPSQAWQATTTVRGRPAEWR